MHSHNDVCQTIQMHPKKIKYTKSLMPSDDEFQNMAEIFKTLGDYNRLRILQALNIEELCVCDISALLNLSQSATSHQLRLLRTAKFVKFRKQGKNVYYSLNNDRVKALLDTGLLEKKYV